MEEPGKYGHPTTEEYESVLFNKTAYVPKKVDKIVHIIYFIPCSRKWTPAKTRETLADFFNIVQINDVYVEGVAFKIQMFPTYNDTAEVIHFSTSALTDEQKEIVNKNIESLENHVQKTLNND